MADEYTPEMKKIRDDYITLHTRNFDEYTVGRSLTSEQEFYGDRFDDALAAHDRTAVTAYLGQVEVTTVEGLDALPLGTVIVEDGGEILIRNKKSWFCGCCQEDGFPSEDINLPATVIHRPAHSERR